MGGAQAAGGVTRSSRPGHRSALSQDRLGPAPFPTWAALPGPSGADLQETGLNGESSSPQEPVNQGSGRCLGMRDRTRGLLLPLSWETVPRIQAHMRHWLCTRGAPGHPQDASTLPEGPGASLLRRRWEGRGGDDGKSQASLSGV